MLLCMDCLYGGTYDKLRAFCVCRFTVNTSIITLYWYNFETNKKMTKTHSHKMYGLSI